MGCSKKDNNLSAEDEARNAINSANDALETQEVEKKNWEVVVSKDEMRGIESKWLATASINNADLNFPYDGENHLYLNVLDSKTDAPRIFLIIEKGQYDCEEYGCNSYVKFGNNPVEMVDFSIHNTDGGDGKILSFKGDAKNFLNNIRKFNSITIEIPFYRDGSRQFKFDTSSFSEAEKRI